MKVVMAYVPVLQRGYINFFKKHADAEKIFILGSDVLSQFDWLRKDIRALSPEESADGLRTILASLKIPAEIEVLTLQRLQELQKQPLDPKKDRLIMPDEEIMHALAEQFLSKNHIEFEGVFLRWDKLNMMQQNDIHSAKKISRSSFSDQFMEKAQKSATRSEDWWRQVGAVLVKDGEVLLSAFNHHVPDEYQTMYQGDPRGNSHKGMNIEISTAIHAEAALIAEAAKNGLALENAELYVTTFPCPNCAKLIAYSGIKKLYFQDGYAMVDGESILNEKGVEIVKIEAT